MLPKEGHQLGVQVHQVHRPHLGVLQHPLHRQPVAASQDQDPPRPGRGRHGRVHQGLVVAVLVHRRELQMTVQKKADIVMPTGKDNLLVARLFAVNDAIGVKRAFPTVQQGVPFDPKPPQDRHSRPRQHA